MLEADAIIPLPDGTHLNLTQLRSLLDLSLQVLGCTNAQLVTLHKEAMKSSLNAQYQELCNRNHKFTYKMFGKNLKQQMDDINHLNKLGSEVAKSKHKSPAAQNWWRNRTQQQTRASSSRFLFNKRNQFYKSQPRSSNNSQWG